MSQEFLEAWAKACRDSSTIMEAVKKTAEAMNIHEAEAQRLRHEYKVGLGEGDLDVEALNDIIKAYDIIEAPDDESELD